jgi:hypothetical protein
VMVMEWPLGVELKSICQGAESGSCGVSWRLVGTPHSLRGRPQFRRKIGFVIRIKTGSGSCQISEVWEAWGAVSLNCSLCQNPRCQRLARTIRRA